MKKNYENCNCRVTIHSYQEFQKVGDDITDREMLQKNIEEFSRIQRYMRMADKNSELYEELKERYTELKVILTASGINLTELDKIKE